MSVEFLAVGDLHEDGMPSSVPEKIRRTAIPRILAQALEYAKLKRIPNLILLGDLFDKYPGTMEAHESVVHFLLDCKEAGIRTFVIDGNHGYISAESTSLRLLKLLADRGALGDCTVYTQRPTVTKVDGESCVFLPWPYNNAAKLTKTPSLVFAHCQRPNLKTPQGFKLKGIEDFKIGKHFWIIGDNHEPQEGPGFIYPGAPLQLKYGDSLNRHFVHVVFSKGKVKTLNKIPIKLPYTLGVLMADTVDDLAALENRPVNEWTKVKVTRQLLSNTASITAKYKRIIIEPQVGVSKTVVEEEDGEAKVKVIPTNSSQYRCKLLRRYLTKEGLSSKQVKRAVKMAKSAESKLSHS